jgi:hypothetical protein
MLSIDMDEVECSLRARLSAASRSSGSPLRFLDVLVELLELCADLTRDQESNEISVTV